MIISKVTRVGNSLMIAIPKDLQRELGISRRDHVVLRTDHQGRVTIEELRRYVHRAGSNGADPTRTN